jgi:GT2 family glycosyltransferase
VAEVASASHASPRKRKTVDFNKQTSMASVSAVVINFNGGERILRCLEALERQTAALEAIVVVDNHSDDDSLEQIRDRFPRIQILELPENRGPAVARNAGLRAVQTELVLLNDADIYVSNNTIERLLEAYCGSGVTLVCPRILLFPEQAIIQCDGAAVHWVGTLLLRHGYQHVEDTDVQSAIVGGSASGCLLVNRASALAAGGFDEAFLFHFEDLEFSMRLRSQGHHLMCEPAAVVYHDRGRGTPSLAFRGSEAYPPRRAYLTMSGRLRVMLIHYRLRTLVVLAPALALYELASLAAALWHGWGTEWFRAWWWQIRKGRDLRQRRAQMQRSRSRSDRELLTDGPLPLAPGFIRSRAAAAAAAALAAVLRTYWRITWRWIG